MTGDTPMNEDEEPQRPDYVAACEFLRFVARFAVVFLLVLVLPSTVRANSGAFVLAFLAAVAVSDVCWSLLARMLERRRGEAGRRFAVIAVDLMDALFPWPSASWCCPGPSSCG